MQYRSQKCVEQKNTGNDAERRDTRDGDAKVPATLHQRALTTNWFFVGLCTSDALVVRGQTPCDAGEGAENGQALRDAQLIGRH